MFGKIIHLFDFLTKNISKVFVVIAGIQLILMVFITTYGVVLRYFFRMPEPISYELCTIFMVWIFSFAISEVERLDEHIHADIFIQYAPESVRRFLKKIVTPLMGIIFCAILAWKGWGVAMYSLQINEKSYSVWGEPIFPVKIVIPIGYALVVLILIVKFYYNIASYSSGDKSKSII
jgi:TRAP-type C4-dicarboxylate transport system permease small subunit